MIIIYKKLIFELLLLICETNMVSYSELYDLFKQKKEIDNARLDKEVDERKYEMRVIQNEIDGYTLMTTGVVALCGVYLCWRYF